jgi:predicted RNA-binding protein with PIN domain
VAMHLIIDGYNLLAAMAGVSSLMPSQSQMAREALLRDLAAYRQRKGHAVTVVFDGWQQGQPIEGREHRAGVQVIYSRRGERADQVVQRLAREYGEDCAIVSSDHEIVNHAKAHGAFVMGAQEFSDKIRLQAQPGGALVNKELDTGDDLVLRRTSKKKGNPRKLPKAQRQRSKQLKRF